MRITAPRTTLPLLLAVSVGLATPASAQTPAPAVAAPVQTPTRAPASPTPTPLPAAAPSAQTPAPAAPLLAQTPAPAAAPPAQTPAPAAAFPASASAHGSASAAVPAGLADVEAPAEGPPAGRDDPLAAGGFYAMPTLAGSTGLLRVASAVLPPAGTFRLQALYEYFNAKGFLCTRERPCTADGASDRATRAGFAFAASATVTDFLEGYLALRSYSTDNSLGNPSLLQTVGDMTLGAKAALPYAPGRLLHAGGDLQLALVQGSGGVGLDPSALGGRLRGDLTADLRATGARLPLLVHANLGYRLDNSGAVVGDAEAARGRAVTRIERYGLGVSRVDYVEAGLGVEALLGPAEGVRSLRPFVEYTLDVPFDRQGYTCTLARRALGDQCLSERAGFRASPSRLTFGARANPWLKGLSATLALDVGVSGTSLFVEEVSPQPPWTLWLGIGYAVDVVERTPPRRVAVVAPPPAPPPLVVEGFVHEARGEAGVPDAIARLEGGDGTGLLTDPAGRFRTAPLAPGSHRFRVQAQGYYPTTCEAVVAPAPLPNGRPEGPSITRLDCPLEALPRSGGLRGRVLSGDNGPPLAGAAVVISDAAGAEHVATTDAAGRFRVEGLPPGPTRVRVRQGGHFDASALADVKARDEVGVSVALHRRPATASVIVGRREIAIKRNIHFETNSAKILPDSGTLLEEIADVLQKNPRLKSVEVQGHTDSSGPPARNLALSQERAEAVRERLLSLGVAPARLSAKGYGDARPVVPNITAANRARNRRVAFIITEQEHEAGATEPAARP